MAAILVGFAAVLAVAGFALWNNSQSITTPPTQIPTRQTPSGSKAESVSQVREYAPVPAAKTSADLDKYSAELDRLNIDSLDEAN